MDEVNQTLKKQIAALLRVISAANYYKQDNVPCQIEEGLFLGSVGAAANKDALKNFNVTHVLTVANTLTPAHPDDFVYKTINVVDREDADIKQYFNECFDFIDEGKRVGGTLVHCFAGRSRSFKLRRFVNLALICFWIQESSVAVQKSKAIGDTL
ncbi:dual specificity protein phosphatase 1-like isoform X2 [Neltuma alba]|uniref:dual specificity protein phosphatase 1-like isoform X2 n=1 Tax=Neltuma alba TaxID=207710 RepID=UPI0010A32C87|nr:dual specificity protein phosphatase 1-like isoform X2 [Prosopis alba]